MAGGLASQAAADLGKAAPPVQSAGISEIVMMSATELAQAIQSRSVSCAEVMSAYLGHIDRMNPHVNAIVSLQDRDELMKQARERDEALARGRLMGWLHGFPQAIKDLANTKGIRTTQGSPILADFVPHSATIAELRGDVSCCGPCIVYWMRAVDCALSVTELPRVG